MRKLVFFFSLALLLNPNVRADLVSGPRLSFLWNQFNSVTVLDTFALATTDFGVALLRLNPETGVFDADTTVLFSNRALSIKVAEARALVRTSAGIVNVLDISSLPTLHLIGEYDIGVDVDDAVLVGTDLYLACGYSGLRHYTLEGYQALTFVDSSLAPVHCVQLEYDNPYLIVLDDYNGLLRYQPDSSGLGPVRSLLPVPRRADSFIAKGDTLIMPLIGSPLVYRGTFEPTATLIDSIMLASVPERVFAIDSLIVALDLDFFVLETVNPSTGNHALISYDRQSGVTAEGATYRYGGDPYLMLISPSRGLLGFNLATLWYDASSRAVYARPGPITGLTFHEGRLATGGLQNPLELFAVAPDNQPHSELASYLDVQVGAVTDGGSVLFSYSSRYNRVSARRFLGDSVLTIGTVGISGLIARKLVFFKDPMPDGNFMLLALGDGHFDLISVSAGGNMGSVRSYITANTNLDAIVVNDALLVSTTDRQLFHYKIHTSSSVSYLGTVSTPVQFNHMVATGPRGEPGGWSHHSVNLAFSGPLMYEIYMMDGRPKSYLCATLPVEVTNSVLGHNVMYTIGPGTCGLLDLSYEIPRMIEFGGYGGNYIAIQDSLLATSDGSAVHLYRIPDASTPTGITDDESVSLPAGFFLLQNYPNPFNPQTTIVFELPRRMRVELTIYDILGRRVISLLENELASGSHSIEWRGVDDSGTKVASGVYFYRLTAEGISECRKMVYLK
jgi:hypothetical protein